jgi:Mn2+/Fe2+ NRAMP family transporter
MDLAGVDTRRYFTAIAFFLALLFTVIGAEGATDRSAILRFAQWLLQVGVPLLILIGVHLMLSSSKTFDRLNP